MMEQEKLPKTIGKYRLESFLGEGGMGKVYKGFDPVIKRPVAIKRIKKELMASSSGEEILMRFRLEAQAVGRFSPHANIVAVYDYGEDGGCPYIVMEYVEGKTLNEWLKDNTNTRLPLQNACNIMDQLLNALHYSHSKNVVHRDIKPENLFLLEDGQIKISDFGIAKIDKTSVTHHGMLIGTPSYMSPEQCEGKPVDGRSDLFSAAVIFYQLLTGQKPFNGDSLATLMMQVIYSKPSSVLELNGLLPKTFEGLIRKALAKKPEERFQSGQEFAQAIKAALEGKPVQPEERKVGLALYAALAAVTVVLLAGGGYWFMGRDVPMEQAGSGVSGDAAPITTGKAINGGGVAIPVFDSRIFFTTTDGVMTELKNGDKLTPADTYYISFKAKDKVNLYVAQIDSRGGIYPIFPNSLFSKGKNPLLPGREYKFPEENNLFLDSNSGKEHIYFVVGSTPNVDIDRIFSEINSSDDARKKELAKNFVTTFEGIDPAYTRGIWFWHK
ncbi:MAG: serine/threonine-protein kinase [Desulfobulbaceae bacterium]|nr:serine/threonine-protein kinase [Desulfobulbaceae bacterium]